MSGKTLNNSEANSLFKDPMVVGINIKPYIAGARVQLNRYLDANESLIKHKLSDAFVRCTYEVSSLLEHLATVVVFLEHAKIVFPIHQIIKDFRHHVRHDARGEYDAKRSKTRSKRLGVKDGLLVCIEHADGEIKIGETKLSAKDISYYLDQAEIISNALFLGVDIEKTKDP